MAKLFVLAFLFFACLDDIALKTIASIFVYNDRYQPLKKLLQHSRVLLIRFQRFLATWF